MTLQTIYRPSNLDEVVGHDEVVGSLSDMFESGDVAHAFLFSGPSGVGKTSLARIIASKLECSPSAILEFDAASHSGVTDIRQLVDVVHYTSFDQRNELVILDECHALSNQAWQALLKPVEQPPPHLYFAFCTTMFSKVPQTIRTRCHVYHLSPVSQSDIFTLLEDVAAEEEIDLEHWQLDLIAASSDGSPRQALVYLDMCRNVADEDEFRKLLQHPAESAEAIELCRLLVDPRGRTWQRAQKLLSELKDTNPETIRMVVSTYMQKSILGAKTEGQLVERLRVLDQFSRPMMGMDEVMLATFSVVFGD